MNADGDKLVTNPGSSRDSDSSKRKAPFLKVKFGSAVVPIYRSSAGGRDRFTISYYRDGKRMRQVFRDLADARREAQFVAQRIQSGMQHVTDLKPHERDSYATSVKMLEELDIPLVAAVEDYVKARQLAENDSLTSMASDYRRIFKPLTRRITVPELVEELLASRKQDNHSKSYVANLKSVLTRFGKAFPGEILAVSSSEIDAWIRGLDLAPKSRNGMLICVKVLFSFARTHNYLPAEQKTAAEQLKKVKIKNNDNTPVFTPKEMQRIIHAAPPHLIPILAIAAFSGIRMAELNRLSWSAVDLDRGFIELRAAQAKTASRRLIPISPNLRAWLEPLDRNGKVVRTILLYREVTALVRALGLEWPRNVLRHSYISYRIAIVKSAEQVALEAGNSPNIIFQNYRELATEEEAEEWFAIIPKEGQWENTYQWDNRKRIVTLPE